MINSNDFQKVVGLIEKSNNVLLTTHARPDGDACGAISALIEILTAMGKTAKPLFLSKVPQWYEFLFDQSPEVVSADVPANAFSEIDLIIIVDTNSYNQLPKFTDYLKQNDKPVLVIDHHVTSDGLGDVELIDSSAAATGLIVLDLLKYDGWEITEKIALGLFVAVAADTGWFRFGNTDSRAMSSCAELVDVGVDVSGVYHDLYENFSVARFNLMTRMLDTVELQFEDRYATQYLLQSDFEQTGAKYSDTENLIDECRRISSVEAVAFFVELTDGRIKCSLRSHEKIDVRQIAQKFGGGGHTMAAGVHLDGPMENAKELIRKEIEKQLNNKSLS